MCAQKCLTCGRIFLRSYPDHKFCSDHCRKRIAVAHNHKARTGKLTPFIRAYRKRQAEQRKANRNARLKRLANVAWS